MIDDPAEALDILLEELKRQKAAGVRRVSITADSLTALKALAGTPTAPVAQATPAPAKPAAASASAPARPVTPVATAPKPAVVVSAAPIPDAPIFTLAAGPKAEPSPPPPPPAKAKAVGNGVRSGNAADPAAGAGCSDACVHGASPLAPPRAVAHGGPVGRGAHARDGRRLGRRRIG